MPDRPEPVPSPAPDRAPRQSVFLMAEVERFDTSARSRHRVRDLSTGGMKLDGAGALRPGATILVKVGSLEAIGATVMWVEGDAAGIRFAVPIDPERARDRAAITAPRAGTAAALAPPAPEPAEPPRPGPTAGWIHDLRNPYRRR